jgi:hypothetical protein
MMSAKGLTEAEYDALEDEITRNPFPALRRFMRALSP